jgi:hypothetical protein
MTNTNSPFGIEIDSNATGMMSGSRRAKTAAPDDGHNKGTHQ